jgi:hypothetical protein
VREKIVEIWLVRENDTRSGSLPPAARDHDPKHQINDRT